MKRFIAGLLSVAVVFSSFAISTDLYRINNNLIKVSAVSPATDFEFDAESGTITKYIGSSADVEIPSEISGVKVQCIGFNAFDGCDSICSLVIPDSITLIKDDAFLNCKNLKSVTFPSNAEVGIIGLGTIFDPSAFPPFSTVEGVKVKVYKYSSAWEYAMDQGVDFELIGENKVPVFEDGVVLFDGVIYTIKEDEAFFTFVYDFEGETMVIPESVNGKPVTKIIGDQKSVRARNLKSVIVPSTVTEIGSMSFGCYKTLESFTVLNKDCNILSEVYGYDVPAISNYCDSETGVYHYDGVIRGYAGSTAEKYAEKYDWKFEVYNESDIHDVATTQTTKSTTVATTTTVSSTQITTTTSNAVSSDKKIKVSKTEAKPGETVDISVEISGNPGIIGMKLGVNYDKEALSLVSAEDKGLSSKLAFTAGGNTEEIPYYLLWDSVGDSNITENGTLAVLHFKVLDTAKAGFSKIEITQDKNNTLNADYAPVEFECASGGIEIISDAELTTTAVSTTTTTTVTSTTTKQSTTTTTKEEPTGSGQTIKATKTEAKAGDTVDIPVEISGNPGIIGMKIGVTYDKEALSLVSAEDKGLSSKLAFTAGGNTEEIPYYLLWDSVGDSNITENGTLAVLHFKVLDTAKAGFSKIEITQDKNNTLNADYSPVEFGCISGGVEIISDAEVTTTVVSTTTTTTVTSTTIKQSTTTTTTSNKTTTTIVSSSDKNIYIKDNSTEYSATIPDGDAQTKPELTVSKLIFDSADEIKDKIVDVSISVSGANKKYCTTGFHVTWDERLEIVEQENEQYIISGDALQHLYPQTIKYEGNNALLSTIGKGDDGLDGVMWNLQFRVPSDAKAGDVFPIDVWYQDNENASDLFLNYDSDKAGLLMQAWLFRYGTNNSQYNPSTDLYLIKANATFADGYIAIMEDAATTTTTNTLTTTKQSTTTTVTSITTSNEEATVSGITIKATKTEAKPGDTVDIPVEISGNPGIIGMKIGVIYDKEALSLVSAEDKGLSSKLAFTAGGNTEEIPYYLLWDSVGDSNITENGTLAVLHFKVLDTAKAGFSKIEITQDKNNTLNADYAPVEFECVSGGVEIAGNGTVINPTDYMLGEVNGDGVIDAIDASAILTEYAVTSVGGEESFTASQQKAADVNLDGIVDAIDASTVLTYYAYVSVNDNMTLEEYLKKFVFEETDPEPEEPELNEDQEQFAILLSESIDEPFVIYKDLFVPNLTKIEFGMKKSEFEEQGFALTDEEDFNYFGYPAKLYYVYDSNNREMYVLFNSNDELSEIMFDEETSREDFSEIADVFDNIFDKQFVVYELDNGQYEYAYIDSETNSSWSLYNEIYLDTNEYHFRQHLRAGNLCK